jgi:hypothetical protein
MIFEWKEKSYIKDNYGIKVAQTCGCNYSISRKLRTSTSSKFWGFGSSKPYLLYYYKFLFLI